MGLAHPIWTWTRTSRGISAVQEKVLEWEPEGALLKPALTGLVVGAREAQVLSSSHFFIRKWAQAPFSSHCLTIVCCLFGHSFLRAVPGRGPDGLAFGSLGPPINSFLMD